MTIFKLQINKSLQQGEILVDKDSGIIHCSDVNDFINFIQEQYADDENSN